MHYSIITTHDGAKDTLLKISPTKNNISSGTRTHLCVLIDVSGSMALTLPILKERLVNEFIPSLPDNVALVIITFSGSATILCDFDGMNNINRIEAQKRIKCLAVGGATNIEDALKTALEVKKQYMLYNDYLLLLTDGEPTNGNRDFGDLASMTHAYSTVDLMLFTQNASAKFGEQVKEAGGNVSFVQEVNDLTERFVTKALQFAGGFRNLTVRVTDAQQEVDFKTSSTDLAKEAFFLVHNMQVTKLSIRIIEEGSEVIFEGVPVHKLSFNLDDGELKDFRMQCKVQRCRNRLKQVVNRMVGFKEAQVATGVGSEHIELDDELANFTWIELEDVEKEIKQLTMDDEPTYRSLAQALNTAKQYANAMTSEKKEEEVEPEPIKKQLPPMPVAQQEDIEGYEDEPGAKRGYRSLCAPTPIYTSKFAALCAEKEKELTAVKAENMAAHAKWHEKNAAALQRNAAIKQAKAVKSHLMVTMSRM